MNRNYDNYKLNFTNLLVFSMKIMYYNINLSWYHKGSSLLKSGKGASKMTQPELILKLIDELLAEREKNIKLQSKLEEYQKSRD